MKYSSLFTNHYFFWIENVLDKPFQESYGFRYHSLRHPCKP